MINPKGKRKSSYIQSRDINGNIIYLDPITGKEVSRGVEQGTTLQASYPIKKLLMINLDVQKKHNERIKSGQSVMIRGKEVRVTPKQAQVYLFTDERPLSMKDVSKLSYELDYKLLQLDKAVNLTTTALGNFSNYFLPSTYAGALVDKLEGKNSFSGSLIEGNNGLGGVGTNLVFDLASPLVLGKGFSLMTTLGKEAKPLWKVGKEGLQYIARAADNTIRHISPSYDLYRIISETKPKYTRVPSKNLFRTLVYKGGEITDPYSNFVTTDPLYAANYGKVTPYIFESKSIAKAKEPMMGHRDPVNLDMFIYSNTKKNPNATAIIGLDAVTGEFTPSKGVEILNMSPENLYPVKTSKPSTIEWVDAAKAELLVKVPNKNSLKGFNFNDLPQEKYVYNDKTGEFDIIAPKKEWIKKGENDLVPNYFVSPLEKERLIATGISPEEALDIMDVRWINSIEALPGKLRNLEKNTFGDAQNINGRAFIRYNSRKGVKASLNDASTTLNTVFHELGGHGSSLNIGYGTQTIPINMKDILMKIYKHNESLRPLLKPFYQAIKDGNFNLAKNLAKDEGIELSSLKGSSGDIDFKSLKNFIEYMEENQEYSARAIGSNMSNHYRIPNGWNEKQLRDIFTKESVDNLLKNVWNYGIPITVGGSTVYKISKKAYGGKMNTLQFLKNGK